MECSSNDRSNEVPIALLPYWAKDVRSHGVRRWCYCVHGVVSEVERKVPALLEDDLSTVKSCEKGIENTRYDECWFFHTFYIRSQRASHDEFLCVVISQISKVASIPSKILNHRIYICFLLEWLISSLLVRWRLSWTDDRHVITICPVVVKIQSFQQFQVTVSVNERVIHHSASMMWSK